MDEGPITGNVRTLDFAPEPAEDDIDWSAAEPQFNDEGSVPVEDGNVLDFPDPEPQLATAALQTPDPYIHLIAHTSLGLLEAALSVDEAEAIRDALDEALAS